MAREVFAVEQFLFDSADAGAANASPIGRHTSSSVASREELAQAIAVAADRPALSVASKVSQLFDESQYQKVFAARRTEHLQLLVFLRNVLRWMPTALTDLRGGSASSREALDKLPIGKFKYACARVVARYVVANRPDDVRRYGLQEIGTATRARPLRSFLVLMLQGHVQELTGHLARGTRSLAKSPRCGLAEFCHV